MNEDDNFWYGQLKQTVAQYYKYRQVGRTVNAETALLELHNLMVHQDPIGQCRGCPEAPEEPWVSWLIQVRGELETEQPQALVCAALAQTFGPSLITDIAMFTKARAKVYEMQKMAVDVEVARVGEFLVIHAVHKNQQVFAFSLDEVVGIST